MSRLALTAQPAGAQRVRPLAQGTAKPSADRYIETLLGTLHEECSARTRAQAVGDSLRPCHNIAETEAMGLASRRTVWHIMPKDVSERSTPALDPACSLSEVLPTPTEITAPEHAVSRSRGSRDQADTCRSAG